MISIANEIISTVLQLGGGWTPAKDGEHYIGTNLKEGWDESWVNELSGLVIREVLVVVDRDVVEIVALFDGVSEIGIGEGKASVDRVA